MASRRPGTALSSECGKEKKNNVVLLLPASRLLFGLARFVSTSPPPNFFRVASFQIFLSAVQYRSPRVLRLCERTILLVCTTLNFVRLLFLPSHFSTPGIRHFHFLILCILDTSHIFSHQKLIPYGHGPNIRIYSWSFFFRFRLPATYHLIYLPTTTYRIFLTIRRLRPHTRVINLSIPTSFNLHMNKKVHFFSIS